VTPVAQPSMPPEAQQLLQEMHGIIAPTSVGWWPPAPGWWVLGALLLAGAIVLVASRRRRQQRNAYKQVALTMFDALDRCTDQNLVSEANQLLKWTALKAFPEKQMQINPLFGDAWVDWLNQHSHTPIFTDTCADALGHGGYRSELPCSREDLLACTRRAITDVRQSLGPLQSHSAHQR
jgi:hypothetical protein